MLDKCECPANFTGDRCQTYKAPPRSGIMQHANDEIKINPSAKIALIKEEMKIKSTNDKNSTGNLISN